MLDPWITARNRWKKLPARLLWEHRAWRSASAFHALTDAEAADIAREVPASRSIVIPNIAPRPGPVRKQMPPPGALYIGRIHEKKNIGALIEGWRIARSSLPSDAQLTIAGWGDEASIDALNRAVIAGDDSIEFVGTVFESQKAALLDITRFLVLPTKSEGLPVTVLEAWSAAVPTIMTEACHLPEGFEAGAAIPCSTDATGIARQLLAAFQLGEAEWLAMSHAARAVAGTTFGHEAISRRWEKALTALLRG